MGKPVIFYSEDFRKLDFGEGHPMRGDRYQRALLEFKKIGLLETLEFREPIVISEDILTLFHTEEYVERVKQASKDGSGYLDPDTPAFKGVFEVGLLSVSAGINCAEGLLKGEFNVGINLCGGWHHAFEDRARGFCIFNDIAVIANYLVSKGVKKIMVIDYDAHHGDGTQRAFYNRRDVYTVSFHQNPRTLYPFLTGFEEEQGEGKGLGFNRNFPLSSGCGDDEFISRFSLVGEIVIGFKPEFVIVQMGVDGSEECFISSMQLSKKSYDYASKIIRELQKEIGFNLIVLGGGGFTHPMLGQYWGTQIKNFIAPTLSRQRKGG